MLETDSELKIRVELPELLNTALEEPAKKIGSKLSDLLEIIFGGISYKKKELTLKRELNFELFKEKLTHEMSLIPESCQIEPDESIIGPALEAARFRIENEGLRNMFAKLLASSTDARKADKIHPCFIEILKNLSSDDAKAFELISDLRNTHLLPIVRISNGVVILSTNKGRSYCWLADKYGFENSNIILVSLERNGLIDINTSFPRNLKALDFSFEKLEAALTNVTHFDQPTLVEHGFIELSPLGVKFAEICTPGSVADLLDGLEEMYKRGIGNKEENEELLKHFKRI